MTQDNDAKPSRHVGRVEDPLVRDDGTTEPYFVGPTSTRPPAETSLNEAGEDRSSEERYGEDRASEVSSPDAVVAAPEAEIDSSAASAEPEYVRTGHPVRDRLLAKAALAKKEQATAPPSDQLGQFTSLGSAGDELLELAAIGSAKASNPVRIAGAALSSSATLVFGTLFGLAVFALLFALLIQLAPRDGLVPGTGPGTELAPGARVHRAAEPVLSPDLVEPERAGPPRVKIQGPWRIGEAKAGERVIRGRMGREPFLKAIQDAGLSKNEAYRVYAALKEEKNLDRCRPADEFLALVERSSGRVLAFEYVVSREEVYQAREDGNGLLNGKRLDLKVEKDRAQGALVMRSGSFAEAARAGGFDPSLGAVINKALDGHSSVEEFQVGDRLRVVAVEVTVLGEFYRYTGVEVLEYLPVNGKPLRVYYFPQKKRYYDTRGRAPGEGGWRKPVKGAPVTSKFDPNRMHPILKKRMPHTGTDFGAPTGTPIYAASSGEITKLGNYGPNGNYIALQHRAGYETGYSHLSRFEPGLKVGDKVQRLQVIGYVGSTGRSTGPHLHFSVRKNGQYIDPESLQLDALTTLPAAELALFKQSKGTYDALLEAIALPEPITPPSIAVPPAATAPFGEDLFHDEEESPSLLPVPPVALQNSAAQGVPQGSALPVAGQNSTAQVTLQGGVQPPAAVVVAPAPQVAAPTGNRPSMLYLTDKELMELQPRVDDGEVSE